MNPRPKCPGCNLELVYVVIELKGSGELFRSWQCDCQYRQPNGDPKEDTPADIIPGIVRSREEDEMAIAYELEAETDDSPYGTIS